MFGSPHIGHGALQPEAATQHLAGDSGAAVAASVAARGPAQAQAASTRVKRKRMRSGGKRRVDPPTSLADYSGVQQLWASAVALLAFLHAALVAAAGSECPFLGKDPGAEPRRVDLNAGPAQLFGQHEGQLFAFGATPGCAGCEVTAAGSFYDACHNEWQIQRLSLGRGFRMDDATIRRFGDRVVGLTLAVRRNPALDPESDYNTSPTFSLRPTHGHPPT
jgi:hypothetical protein